MKKCHKAVLVVPDVVSNEYHRHKMAKTLQQSMNLPPKSGADTACVSRTLKIGERVVWICETLLHSYNNLLSRIFSEESKVIYIA